MNGRRAGSGAVAPGEQAEGRGSKQRLASPRASFAWTRLAQSASGRKACPQDTRPGMRGSAHRARGWGRASSSLIHEHKVGKRPFGAQERTRTTPTRRRMADGAITTP